MTSQHPSGWRTSSRSKQHTHCVEIGHLPDGAAVRDTKNRAAGHLTTTGRQWSAFIDAVKAERFG